MTPATDGHMHLANRLSPLAAPVVVVAPESPPTHRWISARGAIVALAAVGIALRLVPLLSDRCLWIDEAMLALNLVERIAGPTPRPLDWNQGGTGRVPAGREGLADAVRHGGMGVAAGAVPRLRSLGLVGFAWLARQLLPAAAGGDWRWRCSRSRRSSSATRPSASSTRPTRRSRSACSSAAVGLLDGQGGIRRWAGPGRRGRRGGVVLAPVAFVLGGIGTALFFRRRSSRRTAAGPARASPTSPAGSPASATCYVTCLKQLGNNQYLIDYWAGTSCRCRRQSPGDLAWLADHFFAPRLPRRAGGTEIALGGIAAAFA